MERLKIIDYKNCKIVFLDLSNLPEDEICNLINKSTDVMIQNKINLLVLDVSGTHTTPRVRETASEAIKRANQELGRIYSALIGLSAVQRVIANVINRDQFFASNLEDAQNWLAGKVNSI